MIRVACHLFVVLSMSLCVALATAAGPRTEGVVVIVNRANDVPSVSMYDLARIYRLSRPRWPNGTPVSLYLPPPASAGVSVLAIDLLKVGGEADIFPFYLRAIFRQKITEVPETLSGTEAAVQRIRADPGGIALVSLGELAAHEAVRVIEVDGL